MVPFSYNPEACNGKVKRVRQIVVGGLRRSDERAEGCLAESGKDSRDASGSQRLSTV